MNIDFILLRKLRMNDNLNTNDKIIHVNDDNFEKNILEVRGLLLVDFWAEWCAPCNIITPILEEIANELHDKLVIMKLNIDTNPITTSKYAIRSIPTLLLFHSGEVIATKIGSVSKKQLKEFIELNL